YVICLRLPKVIVPASAPRLASLCSKGTCTVRGLEEFRNPTFTASCLFFVFTGRKPALISS
ncbi:MAG: hypothetical protein PHH28_12780, partial [Desulfuromonadaceae bacterium]|nr:hypothetical protein [Desulfuromonadaceae bacterium]